MAIIYCVRPEACPNDQMEVLWEDYVTGLRGLSHRCPGHPTYRLGEGRKQLLACQSCAPEPFGSPFVGQNWEALVHHYRNEHMEAL